MKKRLALILASAMLVSSAVCSLTSCNGGGAGGSGAKGHVYYLNFKPEQDKAWQDLAAEYTEETGVTVDVETAADGKYEETLSAAMARSDAPTLFQVNGPVGLANWKDYCYDLSDAAVTKELTNDAYALKADGKTYGVGYVTETYGIIVNKKLLSDAGHSLDEIKDFDSLKAVAEDITANSAKLGFSAFTNASLKSGDDWRMQTHLANLPIYYEYKADGISSTDAIKGTYLDNYKAIFDLYLNNSTCDPKIVTSKTVDDARAEFISGQAVFYQNGSWEYATVSEALGDDNLAMIPIYIGVEGEENQGLCTGTENYWTVNCNAAEEDIQATLDFLEWVVTSDKGTDALANKMNFVSPFKKAKEATNLFEKMSTDYTSSGKTPVSWNFTTMPSEAWKTELGSALAVYAANPTDDTWAGVKEAFVDNWAAEIAKSKK